jgi:hypothetical protein
MVTVFLFRSRTRLRYYEKTIQTFCLPGGIILQTDKKDRLQSMQALAYYGVGMYFAATQRV